MKLVNAPSSCDRNTTAPLTRVLPGTGPISSDPTGIRGAAVHRYWRRHRPDGGDRAAPTGAPAPACPDGLSPRIVSNIDAHATTNRFISLPAHSCPVRGRFGDRQMHNIYP